MIKTLRKGVAVFGLYAFSFRGCCHCPGILIKPVKISCTFLPQPNTSSNLFSFTIVTVHLGFHTVLYLSLSNFIYID